MKQSNYWWPDYSYKDQISNGFFGFSFEECSSKLDKILAELANLTSGQTNNQGETNDTPQENNQSESGQTDNGGDSGQTTSGTTNEGDTEQDTSGTTSGTTDQPSTEEPTSGTPTYQNNAIIISLGEIPTEMSSNNEHGEIVKSEFSNLILTSLLDTSIVNIVLQNTENGSQITITDLTQQIAVPSGTYNVSGYIGRGNNEDARTAYSTCKIVTNCQITVNDSEKPQIPFTLEDAVVVSERPFTCEEKYDLNNTTIVGHYYNQTQNVEPHQCGEYYYMFLTNNSHSGVSYITVTSRTYWFDVNSTVYSFPDSGTKMGKFYYFNPQP